MTLLGSSLSPFATVSSPVPFYGQGCNLALEDVRILWELLDEHDGVLKIVLSEFTERRKRNADAIAELAVSNYSEMASKTASPMFLLRRKVALFLNKYAPLLPLRSQGLSALILSIAFSHSIYFIALTSSSRSLLSQIGSTVVHATVHDDILLEHSVRRCDGQSACDRIDDATYTDGKFFACSCGSGVVICLQQNVQTTKHLAWVYHTFLSFIAHVSSWNSCLVENTNNLRRTCVYRQKDGTAWTFSPLVCIFPWDGVAFLFLSRFNVLTHLFRGLEARSLGFR